MAVGEIKTGEVRTAAGVIEQVAASVRSHVPTEVGQISTALPGSASATAGSTLAVTWSDAYVAWSDGAENHALSMRDAADSWTATDADGAPRYGSYGQAVV